MAGKKGAKKTVGKARKGDIKKHTMKLHYVRKDNGAIAPRYERIPDETPVAAGESEG